MNLIYFASKWFHNDVYSKILLSGTVVLSSNLGAGRVISATDKAEIFLRYQEFGSPRYFPSFHVIFVALLSNENGLD